MNNAEIYIGFFATLAAIILVSVTLFQAGIIVYPWRSVLILRFGRCVEVLEKPGLYFRPSLLIPGIDSLSVSRKLSSMRMDDLHVNDRDGTTLRVDLWVEFRVLDAKKSVFAVESWKEALRSRILHSLINAVGSQRLETLLSERDQVSREILEEARTVAKEWGVSVEQLWIQDVRLLPEISKQFFDRVAAQIEMKKSRLEEEGRIRVQILQAETEKRIAELQAKAKSMHPLAVGRAYREMGKQESVMKAFEKLYRLSLLQPGKVVSFVGFGEGEIRPLDAMMIPEAENTAAVRRANGGPESQMTNKGI
jgi:regulator of protease activity HflC (stomatin/prohibitin superfamily)